MALALLAALVAAGCYGLASVLQARAAARLLRHPGVDPRLLWRLMHSAPYLAGIGLLGAGFLLSLVSLRSLPLFMVEVARASSLGVTAVLSLPLLGIRLRRGEPVALAAIGLGLVLLAGAAAAGPPVRSGGGMRVALLAVLVVIAGVAVGVGRRSRRRSGVALGLVAGAAFGLVAVAERVLAVTTSPTAVIVDPATYAMLAAGVLGLLIYATGLQRSTVTNVTAAMVASETLSASLVGLVWLGDRSRPGWAWVAGVGFVVALVGALAVVRFGDPTGDPTSGPTPGGARAAA
jgi:hypothetical protein